MPTARSRPRRAAPRAARRRVSHSLEAVITAAIALLDEAGEPALTFRALAARLGGGVASIYWYVASKDELLDRATDHVLAGVLTDTERFTSAQDPIDDLRGIGVTLFDAIVDRPWLGAYFMRDTALQPNGLLLYERLGQQVMRLGLSPRETFHAVSAVLGFVVGIAADLGHEPPQEVLDGTTSREKYLARYAEQWSELDPGTFPFVHHILAEFTGHDDTEQCRAGLDLLLPAYASKPTAEPGSGTWAGRRSLQEMLRKRCCTCQAGDVTTPEIVQVTESSVLAAMAHPLRRRLMDVLKVHGPGTATMLAGRTGQRVANISHHLRVLGRCGLVEAAPELARDGRERWWRLVSGGLRWSTADFAEDSAAAAVAEAAASLNLEHHAGLARAWLATNPDSAAYWQDSAFSTDRWLHLTPEELSELSKEVIAVTDRWGARPTPDDGKRRDPVFFFAYGIPSEP